MEKKANTFIWSSLGILLNSIYSVLIVFFLTNFTSDGVSLTGKFSYAFYLGSLFYTIGNYGGRILQISNDDYDDNEYFGLKIITNSLMLVMLFFFVFINRYDLKKILLIFIVISYRVVESFSEIYYGVMQKNDDLVHVGKSMSLKTVLAIALFILTYLLFNSLLISSLTFFLAFLLVYLFYDARLASKYLKVKVKISKRTFKLLKFSFAIFLFSFLSLFASNLIRYFVDLKLTDIDQGYFSIIIFPASILTLLAQFIIQPLLTDFVSLKKANNYQLYLKKTLAILGWLFGLGIIIALFMYLIGNDILGLIYNLNLDNYRFFSFLLVFAGILNGGVSILSNLLVILDKKNLQLIFYILPIIITIILFMISKPSLNMMFILYFILMFLEFMIFFICYMFILLKMGKRKYDAGC